MAYFKSQGIRVAGICSAVPRSCILTENFIGQFRENDVRRFIEWTGIESVHRSIEKQTSSDLGYEAAAYLLKELSINQEEIGVLLFSTQTPDYIKPATACVLQKRLRLAQTCAAFDVNLGCSAFVYCNQMMQALMMSGKSKYGLLILGETPSKLVDPNDKSLAMMFGDAGAAILYEKSGNEEFNTLLMSDGERYKTIIVPSGGFRDRKPLNEYYIGSDGKRRSKYYEYMNGVEVFTFSVTDVLCSIQEYLDTFQKNSLDYDYVVLHQANQQILGRIANKLQISKKQVLVSLDQYGNTSGVSIPLTIAKKLGKEKMGEKKILAVGYGIGLSWGITEFNVDVSRVFPIIETDNYYTDGRVM